MITPWKLHQAWPASRLIVVEGKGRGGPESSERMAEAISTSPRRRGWTRDRRRRPDRARPACTRPRAGGWSCHRGHHRKPGYGQDDARAGGRRTVDERRRRCRRAPADGRLPPRERHARPRSAATTERARSTPSTAGVSSPCWSGCAPRPDHVVYAPRFERAWTSRRGPIAIEPEADWSSSEELPAHRRGAVVRHPCRCSTRSGSARPRRERMRRLVDRHTRHGRTVEAATRVGARRRRRERDPHRRIRVRADPVVDGRTDLPGRRPLTTWRQ